jgi:release factor glutamine methyltransferase
MTIQEASQYIGQKLASVYDEQEAVNIAEWVLEAVTTYNRFYQKVNYKEALSDEQSTQLKQYVDELLQHRPVQYVLGESYFMDMKLFVNESVLVPRPETEELVDWIIKYCQSQNITHPDILDIGTGSGCIALALKKHIPKAMVTAIDISPEALAVARRNAFDLNFDIDWEQINILNEDEWNELSKYDLIVSNPPYITLPERDFILPNVLRYEPHQALFVTDEDPQQFYKAIEAFASSNLNENGIVFMELHRDFAKDTKAYYDGKGWQTTLRKDMQENDRMLMARKNE